MSNILELQKADFAGQVLASEVPVLVDFWASWCTPCRMMAPILEELSADLAGQLKIAKVNTEEGDNQDLAAQYQIQSIPNMKLFKGGKVVAEFIGLRNKETLKGELAAFIS
jgi:thioredoxin 1